MSLHTRRTHIIRRRKKIFNQFRKFVADPNVSTARRAREFSAKEIFGVPQTNTVEATRIFGGKHEIYKHIFQFIQARKKQVADQHDD